MIDIKKLDGATWDRFFAFLEAAIPSNPDEVDAELRELGIDTQATVHSVLNLLRKAEARQALAQAKLDRPGAIARITQVLSGSAAVVREQIRAMVQHRFSGELQAAYFRKLQSTTDSDLSSLLDDVRALETMESDQNGEGQSK
jgi:hypothetical protein